MNYSDSERIASVLESLGYSKAKDQSKADLLIFNTCSVKQKAEDRVTGLRRSLANLKATNKDLQIAITGCMIRNTSTQNSEKKDKVLRTMPEVDIAFKIDELAVLPELIQPTQTQADLPTNYFRIAPKKQSTAQVLVPIMTGCDKFCSYCIVPFARGREKSRDFNEILKECTRHVKEGAIEITLIGQTVNSYGLSHHDQARSAAEGPCPFNPNGSGTPFSALLKEIDKLHSSGLRRLRFMSPHPRDFHDELIQTLASLKTICPYIHMPVQSGDDETLRRMNRNYRVEEYKTIMRKIQNAIPGCAISTDIIVGFCGETKEEFQNTYNMYKEMEWDICYVSKYSPRKGTYSERKLHDDVPAKTKTARWRKINDELLVPIAAKKHAAFLGKTVEVLVEQCAAKRSTIFKCSGRTPESKEVFFKSTTPVLGKLVQVKITKAQSLCLEGEPIST